MVSLLGEMVVDCEGKFLYFHTETFSFYINGITSTIVKYMTAIISF